MSWQRSFAAPHWDLCILRTSWLQAVTQLQVVLAPWCAQRRSGRSSSHSAMVANVGFIGPPMGPRCCPVARKITMPLCWVPVRILTVTASARPKPWNLRRWAGHVLLICTLITTFVPYVYFSHLNIDPTMSATWTREHDTDTKPVNDEKISLYGNFQHPQVDTIPPRDATSAEVREYLTSVLKTKHGLPDDEAQHLADRWRVGRGHELRSYTAQIYLDIFGRDVGWVLYRDIQLEVYCTRPRTFWETRGLCKIARNVVHNWLRLTLDRHHPFHLIHLRLRHLHGSSTRYTPCSEHSMFPALCLRRLGVCSQRLLSMHAHL
jgi:hypothetical protein